MNYITAPYVVQTLISILYFSLIIFSLCIAFLCSHHKHKYVFFIIIYHLLQYSSDRMSYLF